MNDLSYIDQFMEMMPQLARRTDASTTLSIFSQNELQQVIAKTYDRRFPELDARQHVPVETAVSPGMMSWAYDSFDQAGQPKWIGPNPSDVPRVDVGKKRHTFPIEPFAIAFSWTVQELMSAMALGIQLQTKKADAQRRAAAEFEHTAILSGAPALNIPGFLTNVAVPIVGVPTGTWSTATSAQMVADVNFIIDRPWVTTELVERVNTILFPAPHFRLLQTTQMPSISMTVLQFLQSTNPTVTTWGVLRELYTAGTGGIPRIVAYNKSPENLSAVIPMPFTLIDPQAHNFEVVVNGWQLFGGSVFYYPRSAVYGEGIGTIG